MEDIKEKIKTFNDNLEENLYLIYDLENGFVVFSNNCFGNDEIEKIFSPYKNEKCLQKIYNDLSKEPQARYFYIEELNNQKGYEFESREGILTYIMLNPSYASNDISDPTMDRARKWASMVKNNNATTKNSGYKYFAVINIYAYRHHKANELKKISNPNNIINSNYKQEKNINFINKYIDTDLSKDYILAYGPNARDKDIKSILKPLLDKNVNFKTYFKKFNKHPYHLLSTKEKIYDENKKIHLYDIEIQDLEKLIYQIKQ